MATYVPDTTSNRWVVMAPRRVSRPETPDTGIAPGCPFCEGNEHSTPPEVYRLGIGEKDTKGWSVRVVPNKYAITDIHEVIIHSPNHDHDLESVPVEQAEKILFAYRERYRAHEDKGHVIIFCNHGKEAGASLAHPHAQLVVVPRQISLDAVSLESVVNKIEETSHFTAYCPNFSQWPYEVWIRPHTPGEKFSGVSDDQVKDVAHLLQKTLQRLASLWQTPGFPFHKEGNLFVYNYYISHEAHWFIRIIPRFIHRAGFELGTGLSVNIIDPSGAAEQLKNL